MSISRTPYAPTITVQNLKKSDVTPRGSDSIIECTYVNCCAVAFSVDQVSAILQDSVCRVIFHHHHYNVVLERLGHHEHKMPKQSNLIRSWAIFCDLRARL